MSEDYTKDLTEAEKKIVYAKVASEIISEIPLEEQKQAIPYLEAEQEFLDSLPRHSDSVEEGMGVLGEVISRLKTMK